MEDKFKIIIQGQFDEAQTSANLNKQIEKISGQLNELKLKVNFDDSKISNLTAKIDQISMNINRAFVTSGSSVDKVTISVDKTNKELDILKKKVTESTNSMGQLVRETKRFKQETDETGKPITVLAEKIEDTTTNYKKQRIELQKAQEQINTQIKSLQTRAELLKKNYGLGDFENLNKFTSGLSGKEFDLRNYKTQLNDIKNQYQLIAQEVQSSHRINTDKLKEEIKLEEQKSASMMQNWTRQLEIEAEQRKLASDKIKDQMTQNALMDKQTKKLEQQIELFKREQEIKVKQLTGKYQGLYDTEAIKKYLSELNKLNVLTPDATNKMKQMALGLKEIEVNARNSSKAFDAQNRSSISMSEAFSTAIEKFTIWLGASTLFFQTVRFFRDGVRYVLDLNKAMTEISVVTGKTQQEVSQLAWEYRDMAKEMGVTTAEIAKGSVEFYRQGLNQAEVMERMKVATMAAKIANMDFTQTAELLTAATNSMGVSIERASDVFAYLGDATATSYSEIATGFQKVGGTASALNVEFEKVASWIATVSSKTRESAETIGTSFNTILTRMSKLTEQGFDEEDGTKINDVAKALNSVGIELTDANGQFRNFGAVIDEVGQRWSGLDSKQKAYLATTLAGTRQQSRLYNLLNNYTDSVELYDGALESVNTTTQKYNLWLESTEAAVNRLQTSWTSLYQRTFDSAGLRNSINLLTLLVDGINSMAQHTGSLTPMLTGLALVLGLVQSKWSLLNFTIDETGNKQMAGLFASWIKSLLGLKIQTDAATTSMVGLQIASAAANAALTFGLSAAITVAVTWITKLIANFKSAKQQQEELAASIVENSKAIQESLSDVKLSSSLIDEYERLNQQLENNKIAADKVAETKERLQVIESKLLELYPDLVTQSDLENDSLKDKIPLLKEVFDIKNDQYKTELELERQRSLALIEGWEEEKAILEERKREYEEELSIQIEGRRQLEVLYKELLDALAVENYDAIPDIMDRTNKIARNIGEYFLDYMFFINFFENDFNKTTDEINTKLNDTRDSLTEVTNQIDTFYKNSMLLSDVYAEFSSSMESFNSIAEPTTEQIEKQVEALDNIKAKAKDSMDAKTYAAFATEVDKAVTSLNNLKNTMDEYGDSTANAEEQQKKLQEALDKASKSFKDVTSKIQSLYKVQHDLNSAGKVTAEITQEIIDKHPELLQYLGSREDLENAITGAITTQESVQSQALQNMLANDAQFYNEKLRGTVELYKEIFSAYGQDVNNFKTAAEAKDAIDVAIVNATGSRWSTMYKGTAASLSSAISAMKKQRDALYALPGQDYFTIQTLKDLNTNIRALEGFLKVLTGFETTYKATIGKINLGGINLGGIKTPKSSSSSKSGESSTEKASDAIKKFLDTLANKTELIEFNLAMNQLDQSYYEATGNINKVNQLRVNEINLYKQLNEQINSNIKSVESKLKTVKKGSDDYEALQDTLFNLRQEYRQNEVTINSINDALKEHDRILRDRVIEAEQLVLKAVMAAAKAQYDANKKRLQDEYDTNKKIIQDKIDTLNKEKALIREEYNARRQQKQEEKKLEELQKLETRFNKISKDNSGMYEKEKLDLAKQIADLREEIYEDEVLKQIELREKEIDSQIDGYNKEQELLDANYKTAQEKMDEAYQKAQETYATYWKEVESIMKGSQSSIIKYLQDNLDEYKQAGKLQKEAYLEGWGELFGDVKDIQSGKTKDSATVKKEVGTSTGTNYVDTAGSSSSSSGSSSTTSKPYPGTSLKRGSKGEDVKAIQRILGVDVDGSFGAKTEAAVKAYQKKHGLQVDGRVGPETWAHMFGTSKSTSTSSKPKVSAISSTLKRGAKGSNVKTLQKALNEILGTNLAVDGSFGAATLAAVLQFQRKYGLSQDGSVGPKTKAKFKALGYDQGGLVDYTGLAMVHGSKKKPEAFLNHKETSIIGDLARAIREVPRNALSNLTRFGGGLTFAPIVNIDASGATKEDAIAIGRTVKTELAGLFDKAQRKSGLAVSVPR